MQIVGNMKMIRKRLQILWFVKHLQTSVRQLNNRTLLLLIKEMPRLKNGIKTKVQTDWWAIDSIQIFCCL